MIPKILHQIGRTLPKDDGKLLNWEERRLAQIARRLMPDWQYFLWTDATMDLIAEKLIPHLLPAYHSLPSKVARIDIARCLYLYEYGGIYFDTDYRFFQKPNLEFLSAKCIVGVEPFEESKLGNAFIGSAAKHGLWMDFVEDSLATFQQGQTKSKGGENDVMYIAGPDALTEFLQHHGEDKYEVTRFPSNVIYPEFSKFKTSGRRDQSTIGVHLCWGSWRNKPLSQKVKNRARRLISAI